MSQSRNEVLLEALLSGNTVNIRPQSRAEEYLLALINGVKDLPDPQSRLEAYYYALCQKGIGSAEVEKPVVMEETTLTFMSEPSLGLYMATNVPTFQLVEGETYTAMWGDTEYVCVAETASLGELTAVAIGNKAMVGLGNDTGEPFIMYYIPDQQISSMLSADTAETDRTVAIYQGGSLDIEQINEIIDLALANGDMVITAPYGKLYKNVTINKPETLVPENIVKDVNIAGVVGNHTCPEPVLQDKTFTENGTYTADAGYTGLGTVVVDVASSDGGDGSGEGIDYLARKVEGTLNEYSNSSITNIASFAFYSYDGLISVNFASCASIGGSAFHTCSSLTSVNFPECIYIDTAAFYYCNTLYDISFPKCTSIGTSAFYSCYSLTSVNFPECKTVGSYAFQSCKSLVTINFPACTTLCNGAFRSCSAITTADFPECITVGSGAFSDCRSLTIANFPKCTYVASQAFGGCRALSSINLQACTDLSMAVFSNCKALTTIDLPVCNVVGTAAFTNCDLLNYANLPVCTIMSGSAFAYCKTLNTLLLGASSVCALQNSTAFTSTPIASGTGYVYVPASLVDAYKSATNWTYFSAQISAIEDMPTA